MQLSDEEYGILLNCYEDHTEYPESRGQLIEILRRYKAPQDIPGCLSKCPYEHLLRFAGIVMLSEGRDISDVSRYIEL